MSIREDILKKYGVGAPSSTTAVTPTATPAPKATTSIRDEVLSKYLTKTTDAKGQTTYVAPTVAPTKTPQEIVYQPTKKVETAVTPETKIPLNQFGLPEQTISQTPEKSLWEKVKASVKSGLQSVGIIKSDEDNLAKEQAVSILADNLTNKQYLSAGRALGLDKTVEVKMPPGADQSVEKYYRDQATINAVKNNYPELQKTFGLPDVEEVDRDFVAKNFDELTKAIGVRSMPTNKEVLNGALFAGSMLVGAGEAVVAGKLLQTSIKAGLGIAGFTALTEAEKKINKLVTGNEEAFAETVSRKLNLSEGADAVLQLGDFFAKGAILHGVYKKAPVLAEKFTKDIITQYKLPQNIFIDPVKIKDIFQTGTVISPEEASMVRSLGLDAKAYKEAIKNGVSIQIPSEKITLLVDKPYWAKIKSAFGGESTAKVLSVDTQGKASVAPRALIEGPTGETVVQGAMEVPKAIAEAKTTITPGVTLALESPASKVVVDRISQFTEPEFAAFGKKLIDRINESIGIKDVTPTEADPFPTNIKINEMQSPDGRPAQFNNQGKIEIFMPDLMKDISSMAKGGEILAHEGAYSKVYKLEPGESVQDLAVRYVKDVVIHEASHQKTMTIGDKTTAYQLSQDVARARASGNQNALIEAQTKLDAHMRSIEEKALLYEKNNRAALEKEFLNKKISVPTTKIQKQINKTVQGEPAKKVTVSEKTLLKERLKAQAAGARAGLQKGKEIGREAVAETKVRYENVLEKVKDKQSSIMDKKKTLIEYANIYLPISVRGKFLKAINNTTSEKDFLDVLDRIRKASDTVNRKALVQNIVSELKDTVIKKKAGFPNVKFEIQAQRKLNSIRAAVNGSYMEAQQKIADLISEWQTAHPDETLPDDLLGQIQELKMVGIKEMTAKELRSVLSDIQNIKETGRTLKETERFNRETDIQMARDKISQIVTGGKPLPSDFQSLKQSEKESLLKSAKEFLTTQQWGLEELLDSMSKLDKTSKPYESFLSKYVTERTNKAFNTQNQGEMQSIEEVNSKMKEIYNLESNSDVLAKIGELQTPVNLGKVAHTDGVDRELVISRGQAIQMHMWLQDPTLADTFKEGLKWGEEAISAMESILKPEDIKMADAMLEFYRNYYEGVNKVFSKEFGIDLPFNENYSPVSRNVESTLPENTLLAQEMKKYATAKNNSLKGRVKSNIELKPTDAFENITRHIAKMEHYKAWSDAMFEFRRIFGNKELRRGIIDFHGEGKLKVLDNFLNDFARDGISREKIVRAVDQLRTNTTKALLGLNWRVGAKQLSGLMSYNIELPTTDFFSGVSSFWSSPLEKSRFLYKNSAMLRERFGEGFERDIKYAISKGYDKTLAKTKNFSELMFILIRNADKFTVYQGSWAAYRSKYMEVKRNGGTDAEAKTAGIKYAEDVTNRVQESSRLDTLSQIQRGGSWAKLLTMFQSQPTKYLRIMENAARNIKYGRGDKATNAKRFIYAWFVVPLIYNSIAQLFVDKKYRQSPKGVVTQSLLGPLSYPLIAGQMFQSIYGWMGGETFNYTPSAVFSFMDDIQKAITNMKTGDITEATTYLIDTIGKLTGTPTTLITKPTRKSLKAEAESPKGAAATF